MNELYEITIFVGIDKNAEATIIGKIYTYFCPQLPS